MATISAQDMVVALAQGMTDQEIADATGVSQPTITRIRNGVQVDPKHSTWEAISQVYLSKQAAQAAQPGGGARA